MLMRTKPAYYFKTASVLFQNCKRPISDCRLIAKIAYGALRTKVIKYTIKFHIVTVREEGGNISHDQWEVYYGAGASR